MTHADRDSSEQPIVQDHETASTPAMSNEHATIEALRDDLAVTRQSLLITRRRAETAEQRADAFEAALSEERAMSHETIRALQAEVERLTKALAGRDTLRHNLDQRS
jgi:hypothetical protein